MQPIRTVLVDDSIHFLNSATRALAAYPRVAIVGWALSAADALDLVDRLHPDLVLLDVALPHTDGFEAAQRIKVAAGAPRTVIVTMHDDREHRDRAAELGLDGFVAKHAFASDLIPLIERLFPAADDHA